MTAPRTKHSLRARKGLLSPATLLVALAIGGVLTACDDSTKDSDGDKAAQSSVTTSAAPATTAPAPTTTATTTTTTKAAAPATTSAAPAASATPSKLSDGDLVVESETVKKEITGDFTGSARITNTSDDSIDAAVTLTIFKGGEQVGTLQGALNGIEAGKTQTVTLISTDKYVAGPYTFDFQRDF